MKIALLITFCIGISCLAAAEKKDEVMQKLDLQSHGIPITIMAPDSAVVQEKDYNFMRDITVKKGRPVLYPDF